MTAALVAGFLAGLGIAMPVGAVATYLVTLTARTSLRIGGCAAIGVAAADGLYALLAVAGGSALTGAVRPITQPLRLASALVLIALAARIGVTAIGWRRRPQATGRAGGRPSSPIRAYLSLLGITLMNPNTVVYFTTFVLGNQTTAVPTHADEATFALAAFAASAGWQPLLAGGGALLGRALTGSRGRLVTAMISSALIIALAVRLLV